MRNLLFAIKHKLVVQFSHNSKKAKMKKTTTLLDGSEKSMIPIIRNNSDKLSSSQRKPTITLEEFSAGTGISDLTIFTIDSKVLSERKKSERRPVTSINQIEVLLALLNGKTLSLADLTAAVKFSKPTISRILNELIVGNLVQLKNGQYTASYSLQESTSENIIAIEAKVRDWKSGIRQAMRYKEYADYSYLAIYEDNIAACLANISVFERLGIGLIGVSNQGIKVHLQATLSDVTTLENKVLAFERFFSAVDERFESFVAWNGFATNHTA